MRFRVSSFLFALLSPFLCTGWLLCPILLLAHTFIFHLQSAAAQISSWQRYHDGKSLKNLVAAFWKKSSKLSSPRSSNQFPCFWFPIPNAKHYLAWTHCTREGSKGGNKHNHPHIGLHSSNSFRQSRWFSVGSNRDGMSCRLWENLRV